jgi:hypothetical protein
VYIGHISSYFSSGAARLKKSRLFEIARVLVRLDHIASRIVNVNHGIM